jgi:hypothetical protein
LLLSKNARYCIKPDEVVVIRLVPRGPVQACLSKYHLWDLWM